MTSELFRLIKNQFCFQHVSVFQLYFNLFFGSFHQTCSVMSDPNVRCVSRIKVLTFDCAVSTMESSGAGGKVGMWLRARVR